MSRNGKVAVQRAHGTCTLQRKYKRNNMPNAMDVYSQAVEKFNQCVAACMDNLLNAREAYHEAFRASGEIRKTLTSGEKSITSMMARIHEIVGVPLADKEAMNLVEMIDIEKELPALLLQIRETEPEKTEGEKKDEAAAIRNTRMIGQ
jgi:DNA replication initiation complex subunit (GINS family)